MRVAFEERPSLDSLDHAVEEGEEDAQHGVDAERAEDRARAHFGGHDDAAQDRPHCEGQERDLDQRCEVEPIVVAGGRADCGEEHGQRRERYR